MEHTGVIKSMKDFYWDIRPKPEYGTIELRVCDTPLTVERAAALAVYLQALCRYLLERRRSRRRKTTTWSTTTTASRPAASAWTAPSSIRRPTRICRCAKTS
jgi:gamma-glutamyl:cysteine ligase YbdK (ATP-grasp superfamily)